MMMTAREKKLSRRRMELAQRQNITDMAQYALEWNQLGADFAAIGWTGNAEICYAKASHYGALEPGAYERLLDESSPIVRVDRIGEVERLPQWTDPDERVLFCGTCDTWTKHVALHKAIAGPVTGWMCGCGSLVEMVTMEQAVQ